jgi:recombination protein RecT
MNASNASVPAKQKHLTGSALMQNRLQNVDIQKTIEKALGENSGAFSASLIELYSSDQYLKNCDPALVIGEAMKAVSLKLPIVKAMGFAYIVAFKNVPTLQIGYKGYIQLAMRTGEYKFINAGEVYEGEFKGSDKLTGAVDISGEKENDTVVGYFSYMETNNGFSKALYWTKEDTIKHAKKYSKIYPNGPWKTDLDKMCVKTVLRNLLTKFGILSVEMMKAYESDNQTESPEGVSNRTVNENANMTPIDLEPDGYKIDESGVDTGTGEVKESSQDSNSGNPEMDF